MYFCPARQHLVAHIPAVGQNQLCNLHLLAQPQELVVMGSAHLNFLGSVRKTAGNIQVEHRAIHQREPTWHLLTYDSASLRQTVEACLMVGQQVAPLVEKWMLILVGIPSLLVFGFELHLVASGLRFVR